MAHEKEAKNSWAPEVFYDDASGLFYILWATTIPGRHSAIAETEREKGLNHRIYVVTTRDFNTFSAPRIYFNPDFSAIDASIIREPWHNRYMMLVKNENPNPPEKNIRVTCTDALANGFPVEVSAPITGNYWAEGPAPLLVGDTLYVYFDKYTQHCYGAVSTTDGVNWKDISDEVSFPKGTRHGTAFAVPIATLENLINYTTPK
jgi:beta-galactosidase